MRGTSIHPEFRRILIWIGKQKTSLIESILRLTDLASFGPFQAAVPLSEAKEERAYRQELVLRFFMQASYAGGEKELPEEFGDYLTTWMRAAAIEQNDEGTFLDEAPFSHTFPDNQCGAR